MYDEMEIPAPNITECFSSPGGQELMMDAFVPDDAKRNGAAVVFVHGGGWDAGERQAFLWHAHRLSLRGYTASTIDYRLTQTAPFPAAVEDCQSAVVWLRHHADRFGICSERIGALGSSSGGHLAACLGVLNNEGSPVSARVNCVVDVHGVHDLVSPTEDKGLVYEKWEAFIGGPISETRDLWIKASPAFHVDQDSAPMLLVHDPHDETVPYDQSLLLARALMSAGRPLQFLPTPGSGHGFIYDPQNTWTQRVWPIAMAWLDQHLLGAA
ncbi:MAG: alpha/beta hydrolase [Lentisphaerae bacterium]|nr:alpha/beta hydrolase [Lentisphaerota bacterium]